MKLARCLAVLALAAAGCATLATSAGDDGAPRPNAHAGPFRALGKDEIDTPDSPYILRQKFIDFRQLTVLDLRADGAIGDSVAYGVASVAQVPGIYRFVASDGRSFSETPEPKTPVIPAATADELDAPEVVQMGAEIWLFYSDAQGIELARSADGESFTKESAPVLTAAGAVAWEGGLAPRAPGFVRVGSGEYRLFYEVNGRIGEATSSDGLSWQRLGETPVLEPDPSTDAFDGVSVGDPEPWVSVSAEGRRVTRVYYTGRAADGSSGIGLGARYAGHGRLERAPAPAFTNSRMPFAPSLVPYRDFTLLFLTQAAGLQDTWPAVTAAIAPATATLVVK